MLLVFNHDAYAKKLEKMSDKAVMAEAWEMLRDMYGPETPKPLAMQRSKWHSDPFACGAVAHIPPRASIADFHTLGRPVGRRLLFAGDSATTVFPTLVLGAFLSGVREAERVAAWSIERLPIE